MLRIKSKFDINSFAKDINKMVAGAQNDIVARLKRVAKAQVKMAKEVNPPLGYYDNTGDLSSSKGAMVFVDGKEVYNYFTLTDQGSNGIEEGKKLARQVGSETTGIALVIVAGMYYARYVEGKNKDVITGTSHYLVDMLREGLKK